MSSPPPVRHYDASYGRFRSPLYAQVRAAAFGQDIGQNGWLTAEEHDLFIRWLGLGRDSRLLDVACGAGHPTLRIGELTGCRVSGIDLHGQAVAAARLAAAERGLAARASFLRADAAGLLPFEDASFDGLICTDALNHLPDRAGVLREWARVLEPGGRLVFTDPVVVSGPLTHEEIAIRSSIGFFLFVPSGYDERLLAQEGFGDVEVHDRTPNMAHTAERWREARAERADELRRVEGERTFEDQQTFLEVTARLARERRLSRLAFRAVKR